MFAQVVVSAAPVLRFDGLLLSDDSDSAKLAFGFAFSAASFHFGSWDGPSSPSVLDSPS